MSNSNCALNTEKNSYQIVSRSFIIMDPIESIHTLVSHFVHHDQNKVGLRQTNGKHTNIYSCTLSEMKSSAYSFDLAMILHVPWASLHINSRIIVLTVSEYHSFFPRRGEGGIFKTAQSSRTRENRKEKTPKITDSPQIYRFLDGISTKRLLIFLK